MNGFCSSLSPLSYAVGIGFVGAHFVYKKGSIERAFTSKHRTKEQTKPKKDQDDTTAILILIFY